jgi:hypothetical protein
VSFRGWSRLAVVLVLLPLVGCGYALVGRSSNLPEDVRSIYVETLANQTGRAQVDQIVTRALSQEFVKRQRFQVVGSTGEADAILTGTVLSYRVSPVAFLEGRARQYQVQIGANMEFTRTDNDEVIWRQSNYFFRETYEAEIDEAAYISREDEKLEDVAQRFAETVVIDLLEGF